MGGRSSMILGFKSATASLVGLLVLTACDPVGPDYRQPIVEVPPRFVGGGSNALLTAASDAWWRQLRDPLLNELVDRGSRQNLDVRTAIERIRAAEAALGRTGLNAQTDGDAVLQSRRSGGSEFDTATRSGLSVDAAYVIDLFGGVRRGREQALANYDASQFDAGAVRLAYLSDIVSSYLQARYFQEAVAISRQTIESRRRTLDLVLRRRAAEEGTELEVQQARALLSTAEATLPFLVASFETNVFHIATLLAEPAGPLLARIQRGAPQPRPHGFSAIGWPADLVRNRPDIRSAERNLAAATAAVGVAQAQLYPSLVIDGDVAVATDDSWAFGPGLSLPLLSRGVLRANRNVAISTARQAELDWRNLVLIAIEEVQTALTLCVNWRRQVVFLERAARESEEVLRLSRESYAGGLITLTDVLDAERAYSANRLAVADGVRNWVVSWAQVQVTTGKGWLVGGQVAPAETVRPAPTADPLGVRPDPIQARLER